MGNQPNVVTELLNFLRENKRWWVGPLLVIALLLAVLILISDSNAGIAPFNYGRFY